MVIDLASGSSDPVTDPVGPTEGYLRILRGGSYGNYADFAYGCRSASRGSLVPSDSSSYNGFRVVLVP